MTRAPRSAMVLAAGLGTRLRPLTLSTPKPLVEVAGRTLLDHAIDHLAEAGVERVVVNAHYKAEMIAAHLARRGRPRIEISHETILLDSGGGVRRALPRLDETFFVVNADVIWQDGREPALMRLVHAFDAEPLDAVLLLRETGTAIGYEGPGDYFLDPQGRPCRRREEPLAPFLFAGIQLLHRRLFDGIGEEAFSLVRLYDRAQQAGRLGAVVHDGKWFHVGTPEGLGATRARLCRTARATEDKIA